MSDSTTIHESPSWEEGPFRRKHEVRWTLRVDGDGVVSTSRTVPYDGQRWYSTIDRPNRADKASRNRMSVDAVIQRHAALCEKRGGDVDVAELRERVRVAMGEKVAQ